MQSAMFHYKQGNESVFRQVRDDLIAYHVGKLKYRIVKVTNLNVDFGPDKNNLNYI